MSLIVNSIGYSAGRQSRVSPLRHKGRDQGRSALLPNSHVNLQHVDHANLGARRRAHNGFPQPIGCGGQAPHAHTRGIVDRMQNRWRGRDDSGFAHTLGPMGSERRWIFHQVGGDRWDVAACREEIIVQIVGPAAHVPFHERHAEPACAAFDEGPQ